MPTSSALAVRIVKYACVTGSPSLDTDADDPAFAALRRSELIGRPLGDETFLDAISRRLNRVVTPPQAGAQAQGRRRGR